MAQFFLKKFLWVSLYRIPPPVPTPSENKQKLYCSFCASLVAWHVVRCSRSWLLQLLVTFLYVVLRSGTWALVWEALKKHVDRIVNHLILYRVKKKIKTLSQIEIWCNIEFFHPTHWYLQLLKYGYTLIDRYSCAWSFQSIVSHNGYSDIECSLSK
jgi:hypothetical protein